MHGSAYSKQWLWRWRHNPLRRHDDVLEAWIVLAVWLVVLVGGAVVGALTARTAEDSFDRQRRERTPVQAVVVADAPDDAPRAGTVSDQVRAKVRWTGADGATHTGTALVDRGEKAGARVTVWQDAHGALATQPPTTTEAAIEAALLGAAAAVAFAGAAVGAGAAARWVLDKHRLELWAREWELVGPRWGGHKTG
ncbi:Rv1733c family protein [Streptomyces sp. enrichment culture]|uniref:Rv1733c family protein n=1 Tax=Streptomyces sp. enrichment culture TaxID=1795815 RepID=UPI003F57F575